MPGKEFLFSIIALYNISKVHYNKSNLFFLPQSPQRTQRLVKANENGVVSLIKKTEIFSFFKAIRLNFLKI